MAGCHLIDEKRNEVMRNRLQTGWIMGKGWQICESEKPFSL
jgi:hypothetical protein